MAGSTYEIMKEPGVISEGNKGWQKALNLISWNNGAPKHNIRDWDLSMKKREKA